MGKHNGRPSCRGGLVFVNDGKRDSYEPPRFGRLFRSAVLGDLRSELPGLAPGHEDALPGERMLNDYRNFIILWSPAQLSSNLLGTSDNARGIPGPSWTDRHGEIDV